MKEPPSQTFAFLLQDLYEIPGEFIACLEWQRIPSDRMRRDVQSRRRHFFNKRVSIVNYVVARDAARGDARRRLREHDGPAARRRADGTGGPRPLLRQLLADARPARDRRASASAPDGRGHEGHGRPRRQPLRGDLQPAQRLAQRSSQATARTTSGGSRCSRPISPI